MGDKIKGCQKSKMSRRNTKEDLLFNGLVSYLESLKGFSNLDLVKRPQSTESVIQEWQERNNAILAPDLRRFYLNSDGISLKWFSSLYNEDDVIGVMEVQPLAEVSRFKGASRLGHAYCIQNCKPYGSAYIVLSPMVSEPELVHVASTEPAISINGIYFFDEEMGDWLHISDSFTGYFRLMISCLGIKGWQLGYRRRKIGTGWPVWTMNWLYFYAPEISEIIAKGKRNADSANCNLQLAPPKALQNSTIVHRVDIDKIQKIAAKVKEMNQLKFDALTVEAALQQIQQLKNSNSNT